MDCAAFKKTWAEKLLGQEMSECKMKIAKYN